MRTLRKRAEDRGWRAAVVKTGVAMASAAIVGAVTMLLHHDRELATLNETMLWVMKYSGIVK